LIIDAHLHLDERHDGTVQGAAKELNRQIHEAGISRVVALHLQTQGWSMHEFADAIAPYPSIKGFVNLHPHHENPGIELREAVEKLGFIGLKLHPRLQEFGVDDIETQKLAAIAGEMNLPVLIDAFPDGTHLMQGFDPVRYANLARSCPKTRFIWAHMGGHKVIDFMMLAKRLPNVCMDCSYSLLYYRSSSVPNDLVYAMRSMRFDRIFYGSDYPDRPLKVSLDMAVDQLRSLNVTDAEMEKLLYANAAEFFRWPE
jgi:uncharacterized protein